VNGIAIATGAASRIFEGMNTMRMNCRMWPMAAMCLGLMCGAGSLVRADMKADNAKMLLQVMSEEKTEINALTAQQAALRKMGDPQSIKLAALLGKMVAEHKAAGPRLMALIKANGGDPAAAKILKPPTLGSKMDMLKADHNDHEAAVASSKMVAAKTKSAAVKSFMAARVKLASKHIIWMKPYMSMKMA
jgi:hypothetical protein